MPITWTAEKIAAKSDDEIKTLRENAIKYGAQDVLSLCDEELTRRRPPRVRQPTSERPHENRDGYYVSEFHFVCPNELGVARQADGLIRSGTWVVSEANVALALRYGSTVALHASKAEASYLQGTIKAWERRPREPRYAEDQLVKTEFGIDFLFEPSDVSLPWVGEGAGEKGYAWAPIPEA
jgi:hypothetical protein